LNSGIPAIIRLKNMPEFEKTVSAVYLEDQQKE